MSKKNWVIAIAVLAIVIVGLAYFSNRLNTIKKTGASTIVAPRQDVQVQQNCDCQILVLNQLIADLQNQIVEKDNLIAKLMQNCGGGKKQIDLAYTKPKIKKTVAKTVVPKEVIAQEPDADYLTEQNSVEKSQVILQSNEEKFCIKFADRMYWPYLAVQLGETFPEIVDNGIGGYDLFLRPEGTIGSNGKDYGITQDGVYWIKSIRLSNWSDREPFFINKNGIFVQGTLSGGYWIAK